MVDGNVYLWSLENREEMQGEKVGKPRAAPHLEYNTDRHTYLNADPKRYPISER